MMNTSKQQAAFAESLTRNLQTAGPEYVDALNKSVRLLRNSLQEYAVELGCDPEVSAQEKGQYLTIVASIKNAIEVSIQHHESVLKTKATFKPTKTKR